MTADRTGAMWRARLLKCLSMVAMMFALFSAPTAHAGTITCNATSIPAFTPVVGANSFGRDAPVGSTTPAYATSFGFHCPGDPCCDRDIYIILAATPAALVAGYNDVYPTNVPGIGVRYTVSNGAGTSCTGLPLTVQSGSRQVICHQIFAAASPGYDYTLNVAAQFVKTGTIAPGALTTIPALSITNAINNQSGSYLWGNAFTGAASGSFNSVACSVTQTAVQVTMPQAKTKDLATPGATTGTTPFALSLNCDAGVQVAMTLTDATTPANRSSTLSLTSDSTAKGVGYQIAFNGTPVAYGADSAVAGNANQIMVTSSPTTGGTMAVPLSASYVSTGPVNPGTANARATFTMSYQ